MSIKEFLDFAAQKMEEAFSRGDKEELIRIIDVTIGALEEQKRKMLKVKRRANN